MDDENDPDDGICGLVEELYTAEEEGKRKESMFSVLLEDSSPCNQVKGFCPELNMCLFGNIYY